MKADAIVSQHRAQLITRAETLESLDQLERQAKFNAAYSDSFDSYWRWTAEAQAARIALRSFAA